MKPINAAMALDYGSMAPDTALTAPTWMDFGEAGVIRDIVAHGDQITVTGSLVYSSNTATAQIAESVPDDVRYELLQDFGFGALTEIDFNGESAGYFPGEWDERTRLTVGFGQGVSTTILQMGSAFQTIANGGVRMPLKLVESCTAADGTLEPREPASAPGDLAAGRRQTVAMMGSVAQYTAACGTSWSPRLPDRREVRHGRGRRGGVYTNKVVVSYAGIAPADDPQFVVVLSSACPTPASPA